MTIAMMNSFSLIPEKNCWRAEKATYASVIIDCGNYYRAIYESICKAKHSIFIVGWDIDSRIQLLRGKEISDGRPSTLFELLQWKARQNPDLKIYLNRWDYSFFQRSERERFGRLKWHANSPENIYYCLDNIVPLGGSQHQKIITVDDAVAYSGGMDIALQRWDFREHYPQNHDRIDPKGPEAGEREKYNPFHDIQCIVAGPAAYALAYLVRQRWRQAAGFEPAALREPIQGLPDVWPESDPPDFINIPAGIALTIPSMYGKPKELHVKQLYLDQIAQAQHFIYMENQFFTDPDIACALNAQLRKNSRLRALLISCHKPNGIMEKKAMWAGRVHFRDILESGGVRNQVRFCYPISKVDAVERSVRIHSKITIIDDFLLRVASSNINRRSMYLDTECDILLYADTPSLKGKVAAIRNDLIREHTGMEISSIEKLIRDGNCIDDFMTYIPTSRQHLIEINDEPYRHEWCSALATVFADPKKPFLPASLTLPSPYLHMRNSLLRFLLLIFFLSLLACVWKFTPLSQFASAEEINSILQKYRDAAWALPATFFLYVIGGLLFFPLFILIAATGIAFPPVKAFIIAFIGSALSAIVSYYIGRIAGIRFLRLLTGHTAERIKRYTHKVGILGLAALRMLPTGPFTAMNLCLGLTQIPFGIYLAGTMLGLLPGLFVLTFFGKTLGELLENPNKSTVISIVLALFVWVCLITASHFLAHHWQKRKG